MRPQPRCAYTTISDAALVTARHSAAINVSSIMFTADVGIRKLKSDLLLQAIITAFLGRKVVSL